MKQTTQQRLNQLMSERNLKQVDILNMSLPLQKETGIKMSKSHLSQYVNGKSSPDQHKLYLLAKTLNVSEAWLLGYDVPKEDKENGVPSIESIYNQLDRPRKTKVYNFAEYQLREQNKRPKTTIEIRGYVSAGTGEWLDDEIVDEVSYEGVIPEHDFAVKVNGDSMLPLFEDGQVIFIKSTSDVRDGQIIVCQVNNEAFVKKLSGNKLVSLNKKYEDISICDTDDFKIYGVVVL
ncbi:helix-turn-helix domain-containing protein [Enterococcus faecium]|uniref:S24 family peptidase n=1 Tax=Enterococcus TaxID=1350 RepID=UPI00032F6B71|nr:MULTISPECIES: S24 family peptidase [Enterococcus]MDY5351332.1 S24 family peptidase [Lactobacillus johnsonii]EME3178417.1 helix-turn-helix domain-containing protein [Enterococcus faecium]EME5452854.1 helix-turn-helix domain-containing protein [Enterococcus faecium]EME8199868.1 helix-turn-helix domain-containing protein [Enterococcus faecium]EMF0493595.1 helix-turn-helix domain-containing protein [Enterococcus faecium]